mgnify:CR=1 FL=1
MAVQERLKALKKGHGSKSLGEVTVDMAIGGMRGIPVSNTRAAARLRLHTNTRWRGAHWLEALLHGSGPGARGCLGGPLGRFQPA